MRRSRKILAAADNRVVFRRVVSLAATSPLLIVHAQLFPGVRLAAPDAPANAPLDIIFESRRTDGLPDGGGNEQRVSVDAAMRMTSLIAAVLS